MAIDPGAAGGIAIYQSFQFCKVTLCQAMPDDVEQAKIIKSFGSLPGENICYMELVGGYIPDKDGNGQPGSAMFNFGDGYGYLRGLLAAYKIKLVLVRPQKWQIGIPGAAQKDAAKKRALKEHAARMFPQLDNVTLKTADALCILEYAMRQENPKEISKNFARAINRVGITKAADYFADDEPRHIPIVATVDLPLKEQYKLAEEWACNTYGKQYVPKRKSNQWATMFTYWLSNIAPQ